MTENFTRLAAQLNQGEGVTDQQRQAVFTPAQIADLEDLNINADFIYLNEYPNPGIRSVEPAPFGGDLSLVNYIEIGRDLTWVDSIKPEEIQEADEILIRPLTEIQRTAASAFDWTYVDTIREAFVGHGYDIQREGATTDSIAFSDPYILSMTDAQLRQGGVDQSAFDAIFLSNGMSKGAFHPNERGHAATADEIMKHLRGADVNKSFAIPDVQIVDIKLRGPDGVEQVNGAQVFMEEAQQLELTLDRPALDAIWYDRVSEIRVDWGDGTEEVYSGKFPVTLTHRYDNNRPGYDYFLPRVFMSVRNRFNPTVVYTNGIRVAQSGGAYELVVGVQDTPPSLTRTTGSATIDRPFFLPTATDPANDPIRRVTVDWGDGTEEVIDLAVGEDVSNISHVYQVGGEYTVGVGINGGYSELTVTVGSVFVSGQLTGVDSDGIESPFNATAYNTQIYLDANANGLLDDGEPVALTDDQGNFTFSGLAPGTYELRFNAGDQITLNETNVTGLLNLADGDVVEGLALSFNTDPTYSGRAFIDANDDEKWQPGEQVLPNETVYLDLNRNDRIDLGEPTTRTDYRGVFGFQEESALEPHVGWVHDKFHEDALSIYTIRTIGFDDNDFNWNTVDSDIDDVLVTAFEGMVPNTGSKMAAVVPFEARPGRLEHIRFATAGSVITFDVNTWWGEHPHVADPGRTSASITYDKVSSNRPDLDAWEWTQDFGGGVGVGDLIPAHDNAAQTGWQTHAVVVPYTGWYNIEFLAQPGETDAALLVDSIDQHQTGIHGSLVDLDLVVRPGRYAVTGSAWHDTNGNTQWEENENPASGVQVELFSVGVDGLVGTDDDEFVEQTTTDTSGDWVFDGLVGGVFFVRLDAPDGTSLRSGGEAGFSAQGESAPLLLTMSLPPAVTETVNADYELNLLAPLIADGQRAEIEGRFIRSWVDRITGTDFVGVNGSDLPVFAFIDEADGTGSYNLFPDPGERRAEVDPVTGEWRLDDLDAGFYVIGLGHEDGFPLSTLETVTVSRGEVASGIELGLSSDLYQGYVGGTAFADVNRDGVRDEDELTVPGVAFELFTTSDSQAGNADDRRVAGMLSDGDGRYGFAGRDGQYVVRASAPEGWAFTRPGLGNDGTLDSDFDSRGLSGVLTLGQGIDTRLDLGLVPLNVAFPIADRTAVAAEIGLLAATGISEAPELQSVPTEGLVRLEVRFNRTIDALSLSNFELVRDDQGVSLNGATLTPNSDGTSWAIAGLDTVAAAAGNYVLRLLPNVVAVDGTPIAGGVEYPFRVDVDTVAAFDPVPAEIQTPLNRLVLRFQQAGTGTPVAVTAVQLSDFVFTVDGQLLDANDLGITVSPNSDNTAWQLTNLDALFGIEGAHTVRYSSWGSTAREAANPDRPVVALPAQVSWSVSITTIPGDTDGDGDIDDADLGTIIANFTGPVGAEGGKTAADGDTDGDGDVDDADLANTISGFTGPIQPPLPGDLDSDGDIDDADLGTLIANFTGPIGNAGGKTSIQGDTDGDGDVDDADLANTISGFTGPLVVGEGRSTPSEPLSIMPSQQAAAWMLYEQRNDSTSLKTSSTFSLFELDEEDGEETSYDAMFERVLAAESL